MTRAFQLKPAFVLALMIASFSCSKTTSSNSYTCTASTGDFGPLTSNKAVSYSASISGGATISSVSFTDSAGTTTVKNPTLPFSRTVNVKAGQTVNISATGNAATGQIAVTSDGISLESATCP